MTWLLSPGVGTCAAAVQVAPRSLDVEKKSRVFPVTLAPLIGASSHTAKRLPWLSTERVGKLAPVSAFGKLETRMSPVHAARPWRLVTDWATTSQRSTVMSL